MACTADGNGTGFRQEIQPSSDKDRKDFSRHIHTCCAKELDIKNQKLVIALRITSAGAIK